MEFLSFLMDFVLLAGGLLAVRYAYLVGGSIGHKSLEFMAAGFLVLGFAHLSETLFVKFLPTLDIVVLEVLHRIIVLLGFALLLVGYRRLARFARS